MPGLKADQEMKDRFKWTLHDTFERSIQDTYIDVIMRAERFIYIETQYFIGSGDQWGAPLGDGPLNTIANKLPQAIVSRTIEKIRAGSKFHCYVVMPMFPEGPPVKGTGGVALWQRLFEFRTMKWMATVVHKEAQKRGRAWFNYLTFLFPARWEHVFALTIKGSREERIRANRRYMVYVHSKFMIVDDRFAILGSANLNERSLAGNRDTEIALFIEPGKKKEVRAVGQLTAFRKLLWSEHLLPRHVNPEFKRVLERLGGSQNDTRPDPAWDQPVSDQCVSSVVGTAFRNYLYFRRGLRAVQKATPPTDDLPGSLQTFVQEGQLLTFPYDMVVHGRPNEATGTFGVIDTRHMALQSGALGAATTTELNELLLHPVSDGEEFLPDPDFANPGDSQDPETKQRWRWESREGTDPEFRFLAE
jgi:hypothetical protein